MYAVRLNFVFVMLFGFSMMFGDRNVLGRATDRRSIRGPYNWNTVGFAPEYQPSADENIVYNDISEYDYVPQVPPNSDFVFPSEYLTRVLKKENLRDEESAEDENVPNYIYTITEDKEPPSDSSVFTVPVISDRNMIYLPISDRCKEGERLTPSGKCQVPIPP